MLNDYLTQHGLTQAAFAGLAETTPGTVSRLVKGQLKPSLDLAVRIARVTNGQIPVDHWVDNHIVQSEGQAA